MKLFNLIAITSVCALGLAACQFDSNVGAQGRVDNTGVYTGVLPCADCGGIKTKLTLNKDKTFSYEQLYLDKNQQKIMDQGKYQITEKMLTLVLAEGEKLQLLVSEGGVIFVDKNLKPYSGKLAKYYRLKKQKD